MKSPESGNAIFYVFIAVALLGALSFAVSQSMRSSGKALDEDRAQLAASELIAYGDAMNKAVGMLRLRGVQEFALDFSHPDANVGYGTYDDEPRVELFHPQGGGVLYRRPPEIAGSGPPLTYHYIGAYAIDGIGQTGCTLPASDPENCSELLLVVQGIRREVCQMANGLIGVTEKTEDPPEDSALPTSPFFTGNLTGTPDPYSFVETIGDDANSAPLRDKTAGCFFNSGSNSYIYYQVLIAR